MFHCRVTFTLRLYYITLGFHQMYISSQVYIGLTFYYIPHRLEEFKQKARCVLEISHYNKTWMCFYFLVVVNTVLFSVFSQYRHFGCFLVFIIRVIHAHGKTLKLKKHPWKISLISLMAVIVSFFLSIWLQMFSMQIKACLYMLLKNINRTQYNRSVGFLKKLNVL